MMWIFCPWCGHRIYQHSEGGCQHVDLVDMGGKTWLGRALIEVKCDCDHPRRLGCYWPPV
jgi:hypothetical protein